MTKEKATIVERDGQLKALKKSRADAAIQEQSTRLQADNAQKDNAYAAEWKMLKITNTVDLALTDEIKAVKIKVGGKSVGA